MVTYWRTIRSAIAFVMTVVALALLSAHSVLAQSSGTISSLQGKLKNVSSGMNNGALRLSGKVLGVGAIDLRTATLQLTDLLRESNGAGELVRDSFGPLPPFQLTARWGGEATTAIFESPSTGEVPTVRVKLKQRGPNKEVLEFTITVKRAVIKAPRLCGSALNGSTQLRTRFSLANGVHEPVRVNISQNWQCQKNQLSNPSPTGAMA